MRLTVGRAKEYFAGRAPEDQLEFRLNRVCERFLNSGKFVGSMREVAFVASFGNLTLPPSLRTLEGVRVDGVVPEIYNHWYLFLPGKSSFTDFSTNSIRDLGDGWAIMNDLVVGGTLALVYPGSVAQDVTLWGEDANGLPIILEITDQTPVANPFTTILRIHKELLPALAPVSVMVQQTYPDPVTTLPVTTTLAIMAPYTEETEYRRYHIESMCNEASAAVLGLCKLRHQETTGDDDLLPISNLSAIELGLNGIQMMAENDNSLADKYFSDAIDLLNQEAEEARSADETVGIRFLYPGRTEPRFGSFY